MELSPQLRNLVHGSVRLLGDVIHRELGPQNFKRIEDLRSDMTELRGVSTQKSYERLSKQLKSLEKLKPQELRDVARSFTLMLELMNACENAYRTFRLISAAPSRPANGTLPDAITYVLTAHPTEARSPQNIAVFHQIQLLLTEILKKRSADSTFQAEDQMALLHLLGVAWRTPVVRSRAPQVSDEADHIYSLLFREQVLTEMMTGPVPFFVRSWVGGDKDGHPGVDEIALHQSLSQSRRWICKNVSEGLNEVIETVDLFSSKPLRLRLNQIRKALTALDEIRTSDAKRVAKFKSLFAKLLSEYEALVGAIHPQLQWLQNLITAFPGLVVPLELREASSVLLEQSQSKKKFAISRMISTIETISRGGDPRSYARGFIVSMTESIDHIRVAADLQKQIFSAIRLPIIPLFETSQALVLADEIVREMTADPEISKAAKRFWSGRLEMMLGYSDSSKECGVLASRLAISQALPKLEHVVQTAGLTPVFFHGSGGSIDRGGGSIEDQTAWWPHSALRNYKVTIQGEMVERSLASPAIAKRQLDSIITSTSRRLSSSPQVSHSAGLDNFSKRTSAAYQDMIRSPEFLQVVEDATPYSFLSLLKMGSRPSKRTTRLSIQGLRAIPWVLCWTQTRVLFPTWWGSGTAWKKSSAEEKASLRQAFEKDPIWTSFIKALGFTLAKVELGVWKTYLENSDLESARAAAIFAAFENEFNSTADFYFEVCGKSDFLWFRPWLAESIRLRSAMIHPLNLLQILAKKHKDPQLLRITVTGISSGMLTTG